MAHFTYSSSPALDELRQGDVLERTEAVDAILKEVHPHYYHSNSYRNFIVLTQSCDLVVRGGSCAARYVTVAAVRPAKLAIEREARKLVTGLSKSGSDGDDGLFFGSDQHKAKLAMFVERLLNNNHPEFFFLAEDPSLSVSDNSCAFLKLSISLKTELHFQTLLDAKRLELSEAFQHKLGYLVGNSYSRVATEDWVPLTLSQSEFRQKIASLVKSATTDIIWAPKDDYDYVVENIRPEDLGNVDAIQQRIRELIKLRKQLPKEKLNNIFSLINSNLSELGVDPSIQKKLENRLRSNPSFSVNLRL